MLMLLAAVVIVLVAYFGGRKIADVVYDLTKPWEGEE